MQRQPSQEQLVREMSDEGGEGRSGEEEGDCCLLVQAVPDPISFPFGQHLGGQV